MQEVLVASDVAQRRLVLASALRMHDYQVADNVSRPATLVHLVNDPATGEAPVLLVDVDLGQPEWASAVRRFARARPKALIVLVTASRSKTTEKEAREAGVTRILLRPFSFPQLLDAIQPQTAPKAEGADPGKTS